MFAAITNDVITLSELGLIVQDEWFRTPTLRENIELDVFVVMPNHLHAIFYMTGAHGMHPGEGGNASSRAWNKKGGHVGRAHISAPS